jgi:glycosyltransferase involved in cell wall biosynthesis
LNSLKRITYIISGLDKGLAFEWIVDNIDKDQFKLSFILLNNKDTELEQFLINRKMPVERVSLNGKIDYANATLKVCRLLMKQKAEIVHTHLFNANMIGLSAAWLLRLPKRIYTRHHSSFHHEYFKNAVKYDKLVNFLATDIIAISEVVKDILINWENVSLSKVHLVHHGFDLLAFDNANNIEITEFSNRYNPEKLSPVIGVISRYIQWKGIQYIVPAFKRLLNFYPNALLLLANCKGAYSTEIGKLLKSLPERNYVEIEFENNIFALYKLFDVFVHTPINEHAEAFGQTYVEALASGVPSVFTVSGIANEFIRNKENALVVPFRNSHAIFDAIIQILSDGKLKETLILNGKMDVRKSFNLMQMISALENLYRS